MTVTIESGEPNPWEQVFTNPGYLVALIFLIVINFGVLILAIVRYILGIISSLQNGKKMFEIIFTELKSYVLYITIIGRILSILYCFDFLQSNGLYSYLLSQILSTISFPLSFLSSLLLALTLTFAMIEVKQSEGNIVFKKTIIVFLIIGGFVLGLDIVDSVFRGLYITIGFDIVILVIYYGVFPLAMIIFFL